MTNKRRRITRALLLIMTLTFGSIILPTTSASAAVYGNVIIEGYGSTANLLVVGTGSSTFKQMRPNTRSDNWPAFVPNVRAFYVPPGYVAVSGRTGAGFAPGWHYLTSSFNTIYLQVESSYCYFLRTRLGIICKISIAS